MRERSVHRSGIASVAVVEPSVSQWYARRAGAAALVVGLVVDVLVSAVSSVFVPLWVALLFGAVAGVVCAVAVWVLVRVWPVLRVLWWWSFEITTGVVVVGGWVVLADVTAWWFALAVVVVAAVVCVLPGPVARFVWAWSWCLVVRHRLRLCFATLIRSTVRAVGSRPAVLPLVLWARPTPAGERVWLWLRLGLSLQDLEKEDRVPRIAVACIAKQVRITAGSERYASLLCVDVARRDPLASRVESPLAMLIPARWRTTAAESNVPVSPAVAPVGLELADIEEPAPPAPRGGHR